VESQLRRRKNAKANQFVISGGAGFLGSHLADELLKHDHRVIILDDLSGGFEENVPAHAVLAKGSILDTELIEKLFKCYKFDYVFHLAAYAAEGLSHFIKRFNYLNNLVGSVNLINAAVNYKVKRFVFTSSIAVYGSGQCPFTEEMKPEPEDSYGIAKLAVEKELEISHRMFNLDYTIFRPHNVYGDRQNIGDKYRNVVGIFMNQLMKGEPMTIYGDGEQQRAFTHVSDVVPIIAESVTNKHAANQVFNVGSHEVTSVNYLSKIIADRMGYFHSVTHLPPRDEAKVAFSDHSKVDAIFGGRYKMPLNEGIASMAQWVKQHGSRESKEFANIEISKNLPPSWMKAKAAMPDDKPKKFCYIGAPKVFLLEIACRLVNEAFGTFGCYVVGSCLERPDWRDVDVRFIMGAANIWINIPKIGKGMPTHIRSPLRTFTTATCQVTRALPEYVQHSDFMERPRTTHPEDHGRLSRPPRPLYRVRRVARLLDGGARQSLRTSHRR
jgi:UDP-glucose 4-epimerase